MPMNIKRFIQKANDIVGSLPQELFKCLNGGLIIEPKTKKEKDYLIMGEYIEDPGLGKVIVLYYGSFKEFLRNASEREWEEEIKDTIIHELRHHVESLAGVDDLSEEERLEN